jgi:hypothetical protein
MNPFNTQNLIMTIRTRYTNFMNAKSDYEKYLNTADNLALSNFFRIYRFFFHFKNISLHDL